MTVVSEFFEHIDFGGQSSRFVTPTDWRWQWVTFGPLRNKVSSFRVNVATGRKANVYAFTNNNFTGNFASLNVNTGGTSWWGRVGGLNDDIESALIIRRDEREIVTPLNTLLVPDFRTRFDAMAAGTEVRRNGDPIVFGLYNAPNDANGMLVRIHQNMTVVLKCWSDYWAWAAYDLKFRMVGGRLDGWCYSATTTVEGGVHSKAIFDKLRPRVVEGMAKITAELRAKIATINQAVSGAGIRLSDVYVHPGRQPQFPPPDSNFGRLGNSGEDCCLVLVRSN
jgi:hypothetical protein